MTEYVRYARKDGSGYRLVPVRQPTVRTTPTKPQERALAALVALVDAGPAPYTAPRDVARALWPDSEGWDKAVAGAPRPLGARAGRRCR